MKPIKFKESNVVYAKNQSEYQELPAYRSPDGQVITCWQLSFIERIKVILKGQIWLRMLTFNNPLQPVMFEVKKPFKINKSNTNGKLAESTNNGDVQAS